MTLMLAKKWEAETQDPTGWLMSEKLDGIRCFWDGRDMWSRGGLPFFAPDWFTDLLPKGEALDGELWTKRDDFQKAVSIVRKYKCDSEQWKQITYMVYDAPLTKGKFKNRLKHLETILSSDRSQLAQKHVKLLEQ
jgi:DNA ligase 1